jgi:hypothetical protein
MTYKQRLERIERDARSTCARGCAKCELVRIGAAYMAVEWAGCDCQPQGLFEILTQMNTENA